MRDCDVNEALAVLSELAEVVNRKAGLIALAVDSLERVLLGAPSPIGAVEEAAMDGWLEEVLSDA